MNVIHCFIKSLKEQVRDWKFLGFAFLGPMLFMVIFGLAFSQDFNNYKITVINMDKKISAEGREYDYGNDLINILKDIRYDETQRIFTLVDVINEAEAVEKVKDREIAAYIIIPENYSEALVKGAVNTETSLITKVLINGDPGYPLFGLVNTLFNGISIEFTQNIIQYKLPVNNEAVFTGITNASSEVDYFAPGIMMLALNFLIIQAAVIFVREIESNTIMRLQMAGFKSWQYLMGVALTQVLFAVILIPILFGIAVMVGFNVGGSLLTGILIAAITSVSSVAVGLVAASFARNAGEAFVIGNIAMTPFVFFSGIFFPLPVKGFITIFGHSITPYMLLPATHAVNALNRIFLYDGTIRDIGFELISICLLSVLFFILGVNLYKRAHLKVYKSVAVKGK